MGFDLKKLSMAELRATENGCYIDIDFWSADINSPDSDEVAEAVREIKAEKNFLAKVQEEIARRYREGVTE